MRGGDRIGRRRLKIDAHNSSALLTALAAAAARHPVDDKLLICRPRGVGRELLHSLAQSGTGWIGFRVQTPRDLAKELAAGSLADAGLMPIDGFDELALLDESIDEVLASRAGRALADLGDAVGFRDAIAGTVRELRLSGLDATAVARRLHDDRTAAALAAIQNAYEERLQARSAADLAEVLRRAVAALGQHEELPAERVYLVPGASLRGLPGALLAALTERGAEVLAADPAVGLEPPAAVVWPTDETAPTSSLSYLYDVEHLPAPDAGDLFTPDVVELDVDLFAAASPVDEIREVLRRVMSAGIPWDAVEIIATDRLVYGTALDSIAPRLVHGDGGSRVTHAGGLPISRTRVGRALAGYLRWIQEDFAEEVVRSLLQSGILAVARPGGGSMSGPHAARLLRELRVGWGRDRYFRQLDWAIDAAAARGSRRRALSEEAAERRRRDLDAIRSMFRAILEATPATADRLGAADVRVAPGEIAEGAIRFMDFVRCPQQPDTEEEAKRRVLEVLRRTAATLRRKTGFAAAVAIVERFVDLRVPSPSAHGRVPWSSAGGFLHFSDLDHGGLSGRQHTFVVGLDAGRFPGSGRQDPLLLDNHRGRLSDQLPRSADIHDERRHALATTIARLRGSVTFSYSAWDASEGRNLSPSPVLLQALRLASRDAAASYQHLHDATRPLRGPVPSSSGLIDETDVWLEALDEDGLMRRGVDVVRQRFDCLDRGLEARRARQTARLSAHRGAVVARPELFDPRRLGPRYLLSASRMELLAACPLRYFFKYVLHLSPPDDLKFEPDRWLDALQRGSMFHDVYERTLARAGREGVGAADVEMRTIAEEEFNDAIRRTLRRVPIPSEAVFERERRELRRDLDVFLGMLAADAPVWVATEWAFGFDTEERPAVELQLGTEVAYLRGAVDRIDEGDDGELEIVDYKTGGVYRYGDEDGTYRGGRRLQHALYTHAVESLLGRRVARASYHFPTRKGRGDRVAYERDRLDRWPAILTELFDMIGAGLFLPPFDKNPPCGICDFKAICGVRKPPYGELESPPVEWARSNNMLMPEYAHLQRIRKIDGDAS